VILDTGEYKNMNYQKTNSLEKQKAFTLPIKLSVPKSRLSNVVKNSFKISTKQLVKENKVLKIYSLILTLITCFLLFMYYNNINEIQLNTLRISKLEKRIKIINFNKAKLNTNTSIDSRNNSFYR